MATASLNVNGRRNLGRQSGRLHVERVVDQAVVRGVERSVVIEVAAVPAGAAGQDGVVEQAVVGAIDDAVEIGVADVSIFNQDIAARGAGGVEGAVQGGSCRAAGGAVLDDTQGSEARLGPRRRLSL